MLALVAGIHVLFARSQSKTWMAGTSPAMTTRVAIDFISLPLSREAAAVQAENTAYFD
jgi:hypothetical protein